MLQLVLYFIHIASLVPRAISKLVSLTHPLPRVYFRRWIALIFFASDAINTAASVLVGRFVAQLVAQFVAQFTQEFETI